MIPAVLECCPGKDVKKLPVACVPKDPSNGDAQTPNPHVRNYQRGIALSVFIRGFIPDSSKQLPRR
jgi:hypothetical protein